MPAAVEDAHANQLRANTFLRQIRRPRILAALELCDLGQATLLAVFLLRGGIMKLYETPANSTESRKPVLKGLPSRMRDHCIGIIHRAAGT